MKSDEDEKRRHGCAPSLGSLIFRGSSQGSYEKGVNSTREQWP